MPSPTRVPDLLRQRAATAPEVTALVVDGGATLTYAAWERRADTAAAALVQRGVQPGDRVVLHFDNADWVDYAVGYLAVLVAGAVAVPTSPRFSARELARIVDHAGAALLVAASDPGVDGPAIVGPRDLEAATASLAAAPAAPSDDPADALAEIVYTSGTTGAPRGVACTHANLLVHDLPGTAPQGPVAFAHAFPIGTNAGQECLRMPLRRVATAVALPRFDAERLCAVVATHRIRRLQLVPAMAELLVSSGAPGRHDVSSVEGIVLSSAPAASTLWGRLAEAFPGATLWNAYALTESGGARTLARHDPGAPTSVGQPVGRTEVRLVDDAGEVVGPGVVGEVQLRRLGAPRRTYYRDPEATDDLHDGDWLRTGDLGRLDDDGRLHLVDRKKDIVISGGTSISTLEVEDALHRHDRVRDAAAFGVPHPVLGQAVAAAVVLSGPATERDLQAVVRRHLGEHKVPRRVHVVEELPRNASGKVLKRELRDRLAADPAPTADPRPRDDIEAAVLTVWQQVLGIHDVGIHDDFFELGGHSLTAAQVVARLEDAFEVELPVTAVFERPTVVELAALVTRARRGVASS